MNRSDDLRDQPIEKTDCITRGEGVRAVGVVRGIEREEVEQHQIRFCVRG